MPFSDDQLLARCRAGDLDAFGQVYAQYERLVFRCAYHLLGHTEDAKDVTQETFLRAYQAIGKFRGHSSLLTWLLKICRNLCRDRLKSWEKQRVITFDASIVEEALGRCEESADPAALLEQAQMADIVQCALGGLSPTQREIIVLRDIERLSCGEVAEILDCSRTSVSVRLFRARHLLKERVMALLQV